MEVIDLSETFSYIYSDNGVVVIYGSLPDVHFLFKHNELPTNVKGGIQNEIESGLDL